MGYVDVSGVGYVLPDGRQLFSEVSFRVGEGAKIALVGPNGAGKTTLLRMVAGDLPTKTGGIARAGGLGVMRQFIGMIGDDTTLADMALSLAPPTVRAAGERLAKAERAMQADPTERAQIAYANALTAWGESGGYDAEVLFDTVSILVLELSWDACRDRPVRTLSGGQQKRFALEMLLRGPEEVLLLDEPDNFLDVPAKRWLEQRLRESTKSVLYVSHDRELLNQTADRVVAVEGGSAWIHPGGFASWHDARYVRHEKMEENRKRWDEEHEKLRQQMLMYKQKAAYNSKMASRYQSAMTKLEKFEEAGAPSLPPKDQEIKMRLAGGRTGKRSVICEQLELTDLTFPFDLELWYGDRLAVLGANGTGKSHFLRLLARGGTDGVESSVDGGKHTFVRHEGNARLGARVKPGHFSQTHDRPELVDRTLVEILWRGDDNRQGMDRHEAMRKLDRYELATQGDQKFGTLSGGQQARFLVLMLELSGATLLLLDEPTDNLDLASAEALQEGLAKFEGTVITVTHDRWFAKSFDRFLLFATDGEVTETPQPVWDVR
ncbi:ATPase subunit of ABC transporter with duplicated ATPase domains [Allocatelliglobosispora scoriae]|uniref:ATPase subunit of ABC transporter with duplicated ATPase domains n=1 Tax=Allocatelliglobosispora scoriae TaxID=643052 RepID=A0A841BVL4_9ACTN|nr:ATP-binding cassette domain-containing protein [Allocatelliglobosispora scoriae]MBB5871498.1 ATPase subunit of ABC transporter with duplicated ATPase domains [Allocatelliglobosispora scoriae]